MGVSVRQQKRDNLWYVYIRFGGKRASQKCVDEQHARDTQKAILTMIAARQFDIEALKETPEPKPEEQETRAEPGQTLREYYANVLEARFSTLARSTYKSYDVSFRVHVLPALGDLPLAAITRDHVKDFIAKLRKTNAQSRKKKPGPADTRLLSKESIRCVIAALRAAFTEAVESQLVAANPCTRVGKFYKEAADFRDEIDPYSRQEVAALLATMLNHFGYENYVMLLLLFHTGVRAGECAGLHWEDLDVKNRVLLVRRQISRRHTGKTKTRKKRAVDVSNVLMAELLKLKKQRHADFLAKGKNEIPQFIFLGPGQWVWEKGKRKRGGERKHVDMDNWRNRSYWMTCDRAGIRRRRLHDTRHTFASLLLSNREPLKYVSAQLGHASIRITADTYGHLEVGSNRSAVDQLPTLSSAPRTEAANA